VCGRGLGLSGLYCISLWGGWVVVVRVVAMVDGRLSRLEQSAV
jgi:hypothetical protein